MIQIAEPASTFSDRSRFQQWQAGHFPRGESVLRDSSYPALRRLSCCYDAGVLIIQGRVSSYYLKQMAQTLLGRLSGVRTINNQVEVHPIDRRQI